MNKLISHKYIFKKVLYLRDWNSVIRWSMLGLCAENWESPVCCGQYTWRAPTVHAQEIHKCQHFYLHVKCTVQCTLHRMKQFVLLQGRTLWIWYIGCVKKTSPVDTAPLSICWTGFTRKWYEKNYLIPWMSTAVCARHHNPDFIEIKATWSAQWTFSILIFMKYYKTDCWGWWAADYFADIFGCKPKYM